MWEISENNGIMTFGKFMTDLLNYTKILARKIAYYDAIIDFSYENRQYNPFYKNSDIIVIWVDNHQNRQSENPD